MKMYYMCEECGFKGEEDEFLTAHYSNEPPYLYCPKCKHDYLMLAEKCTYCKEIFPYEDIEYSLCEDCRKEIVEQFHSTLDVFISKLEVGENNKNSVLELLAENF